MLAQQGQICSGGDHSGSGGSVAFSIGQPVYSFYSGTYGRIAEGVQQPDDCPGIIASETSGCSGAVLDQMTIDAAGGSWSALSAVGTSVSQSGVVTLGTNSGAVAVSDTVIYASNGCRDSITVTIQPAINITATDTSGCSGEALPPLSASVPGGQWSVLSGIGTLISQTGTVTLGSNTSAVVDTDSILYTANSCTDTILVVVYALPAAALADTVFCAADTLRFQENGGAAISWSWSGPGGFTASSQLPVASPAIAGTYTVTVTDANGCTSTDSLQVKPLPLVNALNGGPYCPGAIGNLYENGGQGVEWFWQFPSGFASSIKNPRISPVVSGDYIVTVRGSNGCYASDTTTLCVSAPEAVCLPQVQLGLGANSEATLTPEMVDGGSVAGTCIGLSTMTVDQDLFSCTAVGTRQVTLTVTDSAGCQSMCQSEVIVIESDAENAESCPCEGDTLYLDGTLVSDAHKAADYIESGGSLIAGASVIMQAGQQIRLLPGFVAPSGTSFTARIDTCAGVVPPASSPSSSAGAVARQSWQADTTLHHAGTGDLTTKVWPNPFVESFTLEGAVSHATKVSVWMQSIQGGVVCVLLEDAPVDSGTFRYRLPQSTPIPAGVYVLTIRTTSGQNTHRVIRLH